MTIHELNEAVRERLDSIVATALSIREIDSDLTRERCIVQLEAAVEDIRRHLDAFLTAGGRLGFSRIGPMPDESYAAWLRDVGKATEE